MSRSLTAFTAVAVLTLTLIPPPNNEAKQAQRSSGNESPPGKFVSKPEAAVPGQYIVVFHDWAVGERGASSRAAEMADFMISANGGEVRHVYRHALNGFSARMSEEAARALSEDPRVAYVEEDSVFRKSDVVFGDVSWGLDRIDQRSLPLNGKYFFDFNGSNVRAYIIDTGIRTDHSKFGGRAAVSFDAVGDGRNGQDCDGHGTHVAGTVGASFYGVAPNVLLRAVRVLDCNGNGTGSGIIAGVDWVTANHIKPAVANMSLGTLCGSSPSPAVDTAVTNSVNAGVTYAVSAGNCTDDACNYSPARAAGVITVAASNKSDSRSTSFSNFGLCVDIFAPGKDIVSTYHTSTTATTVLSGTSMAAPHVAGVAALYLQTHPGASPAAVTDVISTQSTRGKLSNIGSGSPNRLLYSLLQ